MGARASSCRRPRSMDPMTAAFRCASILFVNSYSLLRSLSAIR